ASAPLCTRSRASRETVLNSSLLRRIDLALDALVEFLHVDDHALVRAVADQLPLVARLDLEADRASADFQHHRARRDAHADRRRGDMAHVEQRAEALVAGGQKALHRGERRGLDDVDHHRRGEDVDRAAAHARRGVLLGDDEPGLSREAGPDRREVDAHPAMLLGLLVVLLAVDAPALLVLVLLDARLLRGADLAVGGGAGLGARVARLAALEARGLAVGELAGLHALLDAALLVDVALHVRLHALRGGGIRVAFRRVALHAVDVAARAVLLALQARLLGRGQRAVLHGARLVALDLGLLALEAPGLARVERARLQALLDPLLLVDVALHRAGLREGGARAESAEREGDELDAESHGRS